MSDGLHPAMQSSTDLPMAELAYAPAGEHVAVRSVLAIVVAIPIATLIYDLTLLANYAFEYVSNGAVSGAMVQASLVPLMMSGFRIAASVALLVTASIGRRDRRMRPTALVCLVYATVTAGASLGMLAYQWAPLSTAGLPWSYLIQMSITSVTPVIAPIVSFVVLRRLAAALGETR